MGLSPKTEIGVLKRAVAVIIDFGIWVAFGYFIAVLTGETTQAGFNLEGLSAIVWFVSYFLYYIVLEAHLGWTLGKRAIGIKVVATDGSAIGYRDSIVRNVLRIVDGIFFYLVGAIAVFLSDNNQRIGDRGADTVVVPISQ